MHPTQNYGAPFRVATAATTEAVATLAAQGTNTRIYVTDISGSADSAGALIQVRSGGTIIWENLLPLPYAAATATMPYHHAFVTPLIGTTNTAMSLRVGSATATYANFAGYVV